MQRLSILTVDFCMKDLALIYNGAAMFVMPINSLHFEKRQVKSFMKINFGGINLKKMLLVIKRLNFFYDSYAINCIIIDNMLASGNV